MKTILLTYLSFLPLFLFPQTKGVTPASGNPEPGTGHRNTYAVVVGISDYQDEDIPDLQFADKDAEAFADFLQSPAGGALAETHLKVLINEEATMAQFAIALDWLWEVAQEDDRVIIYFSGHGDVERKSISQPGFLLCWDAPAQIYLAGGTLALPMFQEVISTLSIQNKAKVMVVADACRAGKLSGSKINGAQLTGANLAKQYANEIKILSCQPDEYSIEGEQWGGGRGAFSYHLLDGLQGLADGNEDQSVSLKEIERYLEDNVGEEVAPQSQNPMVIGNRLEKLAEVFPEVLAQLKENKNHHLTVFSTTEQKGIEEDILAAADSSVAEMYLAFKETLLNKQFLFAAAGRPEYDYADYYYKILSQSSQLKDLHSSMRRNYAAALQDDAQQIMNGWLKKSNTELVDERRRLPHQEFSRRLKSFPAYLEKAAALLGKEHYMYENIKARQHFFTGYLLTHKNQSIDPNIGNNALEQYRTALEYQPDLPQVYWQMSYTYGTKMHMADSMEYYAAKALEAYPNWTLPMSDLIHVFAEYFKDLDRASEYLQQAIQVDSLNPRLLNAQATIYREQNQFPKAIAYYEKAIQIAPTSIRYYLNLSMFYLANTLEYNKAEEWLKKAIELDSTHLVSVTRLGDLYSLTDQYKPAERTLKRAIEIDSTYAYPYKYLGGLYMKYEEYQKAEHYFQRAVHFDSTFVFAFNDLGRLYTKMKQYDKAAKYYRKALHHEPKFTWSYQDLALMYIEAGQTDQAIETFRTAINSDPGFMGVYFYLAKLYFELDQPEEAEKVIQSMLKNNSMKPYAYYAAASLSSLFKSVDQGFEDLEVALQKGFDNQSWIMTDEHLDPLRKHSARWQKLIQEYFSEE